MRYAALVQANDDKCFHWNEGAAMRDCMENKSCEECKAES